MSQVVFENVRIAGIAGCVPSRIVDNRDFEYLFGKETVDKVISSIGIRQHRKADIRQTAGDLAIVACDRLLQEKKIDRDEIGAVIFISTTPDYVSPATAFILHKHLHLSKECIAFDMNLACPGYVYGIQICAALLQSLQQRYVLLVNGHAPKNLDVEDRKNPDHSALMMFGDAATATLLERSDEEPPIKCCLGADGSDYQLMFTIGGGARSASVEKKAFIWKDGLEHTIYDSIMDGVGVFSFSTGKAPKIIGEFLEENGETLNEYSKVVLHQANIFIIKRIVKLLGADAQKFPISLGDYGNTASCSIPLTIVDTFGEDRGAKPQKLLLAGFGAGLAWGVVSVHLSPKDVLPLYESDEVYEEGGLI